MIIQNFPDFAYTIVLILSKNACFDLNSVLVKALITAIADPADAVGIGWGSKSWENMLM